MMHAWQRRTHNALGSVQLHGGWWVYPLGRLAAAIYFARPRVYGGERMPSQGALIASNHRNGMLDGMVLANVAPHWTFMVGANLAHHPIMRHFVAGLVVERTSDQEHASSHERSQGRAKNRHALDQAVALIAEGGTLCVFPEGTSALGPQLLPLRPGIATIAQRLELHDIQAPLIPVGLHYPDGPAFRGPVEVTIGEPIPTTLDDTLTPAQQRMELLEKVRAALAAITVQAQDAEQQRAIEGIATLATMGTTLSHGALCRALAQALAHGDQAAMDLLDDWRLLQSARTFHFSNAPLFPTHNTLLTALFVVGWTPVLALATLINAPILLTGHVVAKRLADAPNVIGVWRMLAGMPMGLLWWIVLAVALGLFNPMLLLIAFVASLIGLLVWRPWRIATTMLLNALFAPTLAAASAQLRKDTLQWYRTQSAAEQQR